MKSTRILASIILLIGIAHVPVGADTVQMKNGLKIEGKVHLETPTFIILLVYNDSGRIRIPRSQIASIEYDFESKALALEEDDYKGQYELGVWAFSKGMYDEAIQQFEMVKGKEGAGADLLKLLGQAYDKKGQLDKAYECYKDYLKFHPKDAELKKRADEIYKELGLGEDTTEKPKPKPKVVDGLESLFTWKPEKWAGTNPCTVSPTADKDTGNKMFVLQVKDGNGEKSAFSGVGKDPLDLSEVKEMIFKAYHNGKRRVYIAVAFTNKQGEYFESRQKTVAPNTWAKLKIELDGKSFKSQKSGWKHSVPIGGKGHINRVVFLIYQPQPLTMYVDHVFFR